MNSPMSLAPRGFAMFWNPVATFPSLPMLCPHLAADLLPFLDDPRVLGLAEMMDMPAVLNGSEQALAKIQTTRSRGLAVDGHAPGLKGLDLCAYAASGIQSDHECSSLEDARDRIRLGIGLMIR